MDMDSSSSSDEDLTSSSECESDSSYSQTENFEVVKICGQRFQLPQGLCESEKVFKEFFSARMWNILTDGQRQHLKKFLPTFPDDNNTEKHVTVQKLFGGEKIGFSNPLDDLHKNLKAGNYRPEIVRMRSLMRRVQRRESRLQQKRYMNNLVKDVIASRTWLLNMANSLPPEASTSTSLRCKTTNGETNPAQRTRKRYFQELEAIRAQVGDTSAMSDDENYPEGCNPSDIAGVSASKCKQRRFSSPSSPPASPGVEELIVPTTATTTSQASLKVSSSKSDFMRMTDEMYRSLLLNHKSKAIGKSQLSPSSWMSYLKEIASRTLNTTNNKKTLQNLQKSISIYSTEMRMRKAAHKSPVATPTPKVPKEPKVTKTPPKKEPEPPPSLASVELTSTSADGLNRSIGNKSDSDSETIIDPVYSPIKSIPTTMDMVPPPLASTETDLLSDAIFKTEIENTPIKTEDCIVKTEFPEPIIKTEPLENQILIKKEQPPPPPPPLMNEFCRPATISDLEGIDMLNLPVDLDESNIIEEITRQKTPELMQETHASFLSLIRDIICSTPDHRMSYDVLESRLRTWVENPISPLNDWYNLVDNWLEVLPCAVSFLHGDFPMEDDFVPYLELKELLQEYQWIGAGRDSDNLLAPLFHYWIDHRQEMFFQPQQTVKAVEEQPPPQSPPPPRCPTNWTVRKAEAHEIDIFREQERRRYENPHKAFTYRMFGYESVVGPVKGIYNQQGTASGTSTTKPRGHSMLSSDRPNFVTILTLVRDATARLPNGEGTRAEICELLKSSQYIAPGASDTVLQSVVSGALDRMHTEYDPCVKYDTKRKIWIYLHRNRTESEFERIHQQHQGMSKHQKKNTSRKSKTPKVKAEKPVTEKPASSPCATDKFKTPTTTATITTPAGTSLLINQNKRQVKKVINQAVISQPSVMSASSSPAVTTTVQTLQSIIAPRVNSPVLKPIQSVPKPATKSIVKILNSPHQQLGKSLTGPPQLYVKQTSQVIPTNTSAASSGGTIQTIIPSFKTSESSNSQLLAQKLIANTQILQIQQPTRQTATSSIGGVTRQLVKPQGATILTTGSGLSQQIIQVAASSAAAGSSSQKMHSPTAAKPKTVLVQQLLQNLKQQQGKVVATSVGTQQQQQTSVVANLKQQVTLQQLQKQLQQASAVAAAKQAAGTSLLDQQRGQVKSTSGTSSAPLVAKVLTNASGQVISVESLLAHQKQHGSLPQGTTLRVTTDATSSGGKLGTNVIQTPFAVVSQGNLISLTATSQGIVGQPRLIATSQTTSANHIIAVATPGKNVRQTTKLTTTTTPANKVTHHQLINAKFITTQNAAAKLTTQQQTQKTVSKLVTTSKPITASSQTIRMVNPTQWSIAGKPILIASKGCAQNIILRQGGTTTQGAFVISNTSRPTILSTPLKNTAVDSNSSALENTTAPQQQQAVLLASAPAASQEGGATTSTAGVSAQRVVLAQGQGGQLVAQQILLPQGFQGGTINIKTLQGLKVIPLAATQQAKGEKISISNQNLNL